MSYLPSGIFSVTSVSTTYTALLTDYLIKGNTTSAAFTINLPTAIGNGGKEFVIKNLGTKNLTIDGNGSETIDGALTKILTNQYASVNLLSDNANWMII